MPVMTGSKGRGIFPRVAGFSRSIHHVHLNATRRTCPGEVLVRDLLIHNWRNRLVKRTYLVLDRQDLPKGSHGSYLFPECVYTLKREDDGRTFQVTLSKAMHWERGASVELEDLLVEALQS